jgi:hypothetical protein
MKWSDVKRPVSRKTLRQFSGLCLVIFGGMFAWRASHESLSPASWGLALLALIGVIGLVKPTAVRGFYRLWMMAVFPIGWALSKIIMTVLFFVVFTPVALVFRIRGRDELRRRRPNLSTYWLPKDVAESPKQYFNQF